MQRIRSSHVRHRCSFGLYSQRRKLDLAPAFAPVLPNITFDRNLVLHCDDATVEVRYLGPGAHRR
jgi:hypothetical protein